MKKRKHPLPKNSPALLAMAITMTINGADPRQAVNKIGDSRGLGPKAKMHLLDRLLTTNIQ